MDEMKLKREVLEELMAYIDGSQASELHEEMEKRKPKPKAMAVEIEVEKKPLAEAVEESPMKEMHKEAEADDEEEMSDEEIEEMLKGLG